MSELNLSENMDEGVVKLMNDDEMPMNQRGTSTVQKSVNQLESARVKTPVSDAVKQLESESEIFPEKEQVAKTTTVTEASDNKTATTEKNVNNKVLGMKPLTLGLVVVAVGVLGYFAYKQIKTKALPIV